VTQCRLRSEHGEEILSLDELEERIRTGQVPGSAWVSVEGLTAGFVRLRDSPFAPRWDPVARARFREAFALDRFPVLAVAIAAAVVGLHLYAEHRSGGGVPDRDVLVALGARARWGVLFDGEAWRMWTGAVLHRDRVHLAFNVAVFAAVGGALESIYTRAGFLAVVVLGALGSALLSLQVGPPVTVGLSGVVFAALGACVGFGARFRDVLRRPYQHWFGLAALAYALFALWTSARAPEVDHAGHLGGLLGGLLAGLMLPPRRWKDPFQMWWLDPGLLLAGILCSGVAAGMIHQRAPGQPRLGFQRVGAAGVQLPVPEGFSATRDAFGWAAFDNGLDAQVSLGCTRAEAAWPRQSPRRGPAEHLATSELQREAIQRELADFSFGSPRWTTVGSQTDHPHLAQELALRYRVPHQDVSARLLVWDRGLFRCGLMLATRAGATTRRAAMLDRVRANLKLGPTESWQHAKAAVDADPAGMLAHLDWGLASVQVGDATNARTSLERALRLAPPDSVVAARAHYAMAQLGLLTLETDLALPHAARARELVPQDVDVAVALYGALKLSGLGDTPAARLLADGIRQVKPQALRPGP
jgi:membrane associated rhomboid family serine protease